MSTNLKVGDKVVYTDHFLGHRTAEEKLTGTVGEITGLDTLGGEYATVKYPPGVWGSGRRDVTPALLIKNLVKVDDGTKPESEPDIQIDVFNYLRGHGSTNERKLAMKDLTDRGFFRLELTHERAMEVLQSYLTTNPQRFCDGGIKRFREALKLDPPAPKRSPLHPAALLTTDLVKGDIYVLHEADQGSYHGTAFLFLGEIKTNSSGYETFRAVNLSTGNQETVYSADRGLSPYNPTGEFSEFICAIPGKVTI